MYNIHDDTGVAIIFFNRPDCVKKVFESVAKAQPPKLFLIQDGARKDADILGIEACREIVDNITWPCEVYKNYSDVNLGCGKRMSSGISWVFEHVEKAMILEDDCVPGESFYQFCDELLEKYADDERIMMISGMNHWDKSDIQEDYLFAYSGAIWGWATWKRSWEHFDFSVEAIEDPNVIKTLMSGIEPKRIAERDIAKWRETRKKILNNEKISYWAHQWRLCKFIYHNLCIIPRCNLITNVGDHDATHPGSGKSDYHFLKTHKLDFPLKHPQYILPNQDYDNQYYKIFEPTRLYRISQHIKGWFKLGNR